MSQPLPPNTFRNSEPTFQAYKIALELERCSPEDLANLRAAQLQLSAGQSIIDADYVKMLARVLGHVIIEFTGSERYMAAHEVIACETAVARFKLAIDYINRLIFPWIKTTSKPYAESRTSMDSLPEHDAAQIRCQQLLAQPNVASPMNHTDAKILALSRDDTRCILTGIRDRIHRPLERGQDRRGTHACHIFPRKLLPAASTDDDQTGNGGVWAVLSRFGVLDLDEEFLGAKINRTQNILTLCTDYQDKFNRLEVWLEPIEINMPPSEDNPLPHAIDLTQDDPKWLDDSASEPVSIVCKVGTIYEGSFGGDLRTSVTIQNHSDKRIRLPSPRYLALHAAVARVAHLSGAGEYVARLIYDEEDRIARTHVLAADGSDYDLIMSTLSQVVAAS